MQTCRMREPSKRKEPGHIDEIQPLEREHKMVVNIIHKWVGIFFEGIFLVSCTYIKWISFSLMYHTEILRTEIVPFSYTRIPVYRPKMRVNFFWEKSRLDIIQQPFFCQGYLNLAVPDLHNYFKNLLKGLRI